MYEELKSVLSFFKAHQPFSFTYLFKTLPLDLSAKDKEKLKTLLIEDNIVESIDEGEEFGKVPKYTLTDYGSKFHNEISEFEILDRILKYFADHKNSYLDMDYVCNQINVPFSKTYGLRLIKEGLVLVTEDKNGRSYTISPAGEYHLFSQGGYVRQLISAIESTLIENREERERRKNQHQPINNIQATNYFHNVDSTIGKQGIFNETKKEDKKHNWLQYLYWVIGILGTLTALWTFAKTLF